MNIDHDEATHIAQGYGTTYTSPSDEAVRKVFAAYLELKERDDERVCCAESERMRESSKRRTCELERGCDELKKKLAAASADAARAELRARDLLKAITEVDSSLAELDAHPDSDARLREVMGLAIDAAWESESHQNDETKNRLIDEVLGVKP